MYHTRSTRENICSPLSCLQTVKKGRCLSRYLSPPATPEYIPRTPEKKSTGSSDQGKRKLDELERSAPKTPPKSRKLTVRTPIALRLNPPTRTSETSGTRKSIIHFFLGNSESDGAIPVNLSSYMTSTAFFDKAESAWSYVQKSTETVEFMGVSVMMDGLEWPLILEWRNGQAFENMLESIDTAKIAGTGDITVKVKCITK